MKWEIIVLWESCNHLGQHVRAYSVDSLTQALKEKFYIRKKDPTVEVIIRRVSQ